MKSETANDIVVAALEAMEDQKDIPEKVANYVKEKELIEEEKGVYAAWTTYGKRFEDGKSRNDMHLCKERKTNTK